MGDEDCSLPALSSFWFDVSPFVQRGQGCRERKGLRLRIPSLIKSGNTCLHKETKKKKKVSPLGQNT